MEWVNDCSWCLSLYLYYYNINRFILEYKYIILYLIILARSPIIWHLISRIIVNIGINVDISFGWLSSASRPSALPVYSVLCYMVHQVTGQKRTYTIYKFNIERYTLLWSKHWNWYHEYVIFKITPSAPYGNIRKHTATYGLYRNNPLAPIKSNND